MGLSETVLGTTTTRNIEDAIKQTKNFVFDRPGFIDACQGSPYFMAYVETLTERAGNLHPGIAVPTVVSSAICLGIEIGMALRDTRLPTVH